MAESQRQHRVSSGGGGSPRRSSRSGGGGGGGGSHRPRSSRASSDASEMDRSTMVSRFIPGPNDVTGGARVAQ
eukprot:scaffold31241_cov54-Phaeocystis_antarctica.AAC.1